MGKDEDRPHDPVGYKKPPTKTQFKKGSSGNPGGRPKKTSPSFDDLVIRRLEAAVPHGDCVVVELILNKAIKNAVQGDMKATKFLCEAYILAKSVRKRAGTDEDADREAAERIFDLDPRFYTEVTEPDTTPSDTSDATAVKTDGESDHD